MTSEKPQKGIVIKILNKLSYRTGSLCRKVTTLSNVTNTKPWGNIVSGTQELSQTVSEKSREVFTKAKTTLEKNVGDIKEAFTEGLKAEEAKADIAVKKVAKTQVEKTKDKITKKIKDPGKTSKKSGRHILAKENVPLNADMEKEIEIMTRNVHDIEG
jgi:hypothetical protein